MKVFRNICRILIGMVFIFSGFVKGVDPLGTVYRMNDYFQIFRMGWAMPLSLFLTIFLCTLEFVIGISFLLNLGIRYSTWVQIPLLLFFTVLTFFDATYNLVPDCGCFGDALKLTNLQTFLKNLALLALSIPVFAGRKKFKSIVKSFWQEAILFLTALAFASGSIYSYRHLPVIDFLGWKKGDRVNQAHLSPVKFYVTYKNKITGEEKEYLSPNYPWNDSVWMSKWVFKSQRTEDPNKGNVLLLRAEDLNGNDVTNILVDNPDYQFLWVAWDLSGTNKDAVLKILPFYKEAEKDGHSFVCLTSAEKEDVERFRLANGTSFEYYLADDVVLKAMIRANPGLILLKNGVVLGKWHYRDIPSYKELMNGFKQH
ncbi:MAG: hypothetical protein Q8867_01685 [Bacteroidota bacterium]|nr:hypothetical protein [Bacteroidota bacterium]